jgi:NAD(P)-dependent dehydrogenase (short-subunit alcohol dehydrogenase family)
MMLKDKNVVITGAGSGVGRAAALLFAQQGARVVCADVLIESAEQTAGLITAAAGQAIAVHCDVRQRGDMERAVNAVQPWGPLHVMFNNAGVASSTDGRPYTLVEQTDDDFDRLVSINFRGVVHGCQAAVKAFIAQGGGGVIVNTASVAGLVGWGGVLYGATKGAVIQLTRSLAIEVAKHRIRVNAVCPAAMMTNFGRPAGTGPAVPNDDLLQAYARMHPLGEPISTDDCAQAALFLASDAARNITGVALPVDGGYVAA